MSKTDAMIEKVKALVNAPSCCAEAKEAGNNWLEAVNTEKRDEAAEKLIAEIEADIIPIDWLIKFAGSEDGQKVFGAEKAAGIEDAGLFIASTQDDNTNLLLAQIASRIFHVSQVYARLDDTGRHQLVTDLPVKPISLYDLSADDYGRLAETVSREVAV